MATNNHMKTLEEIFRQYVSLRAHGADLQEVKESATIDGGTTRNEVSKKAILVIFIMLACACAEMRFQEVSLL